MMHDDRPLAGMAIGISVSRSDDLALYGYQPEDVNRIVVQIAERLLAEGCRLVFGHDWRPDGVLAAICGLAMRFQRQPLPGDEAALAGGDQFHRTPYGKSMITNVLAWPDQPQLDPEMRERLWAQRLLETRVASEPPLEDADPAKRPLALSMLRRTLTEEIDARICIGGQSGLVHRVSGFFAGVAEEAYWAAFLGRKLFLGSFLGGVAGEIVQARTRGLSTPPQCLNLLDYQFPAYERARQLVEEGRWPNLNRDDWQQIVPPPDLRETLLSPNSNIISIQSLDVAGFIAEVINALVQERPRRTGFDSH